MTAGLPMLANSYPVIRIVHVGLVLLSGSLFTARGVGALLGVNAALAPNIRRASVFIDSALLAAAILLLLALQLNPFTSAWLQAKLGFLVLYIGFGLLTLRYASTRRGQAAAFVAALLCFGMMVSIARSHDPAGFLRSFVG